MGRMGGMGGRYDLAGLGGSGSLANLYREYTQQQHVEHPGYMGQGEGFGHANYGRGGLANGWEPTFEEPRVKKSKVGHRNSWGGEMPRPPPKEPRLPKELPLKERDPEAYELHEVKAVLEKLVLRTEKAVLSEEMKLERQREKEAAAIEKARNKEQQGTEREVRLSPFN